MKEDWKHTFIETLLSLKIHKADRKAPSCLLCVHKIIQFVAKWLTDISKKHILKIVTITI